MFDFKLLRSLRKDLGMSQMALARASGISLPMLQLIESGKANPSMRLMEQLAKPLFLSLTIAPKKADWDKLASLGLPLGRESFTPRMTATNMKSDLKPELIKACFELQNPKQLVDFERKKISVESMLSTLASHYPKFFKEEFGTIEVIKRFLPANLSGKHIKLRRLISERMSRYL